MQILTKQFTSEQQSWNVLAAVSRFSPEKMRRTAVMVLLQERRGEAALRALLEAYALRQAVQSGALMVLCPQMPETGWQWSRTASPAADERMVEALLNQSDERWWMGWQADGDLHYLFGIDAGADLVCSLVARHPTPGCAAAVCAIRPTLDLPIDLPCQSAIPAMLADAPASVVQFFSRAGDTVVYPQGFPPAEIWPWMNRFRRINTSPTGDTVLRTPLPAAAVLRHNVLLSDGLAHSWIEAPPALTSPSMPLMLVSHGMGDNPMRVAEQTGMHCVGMREGFLTVYPMASNGERWNLTRSADLPDDLAYYEALIQDLCSRYPIDRERIYVSGFSNGAGMAMLFALTHPHMVAAACPIDSTFPYASMQHFKPSRITPYLQAEGVPPRAWSLPPTDAEAALSPLREALARQGERAVPLRLPVMYFYGTRESEFPVRTGSNQELSSRFWRQFNGIDAPAADNSLTGAMAVGTPGEQIRTFQPDARYPHHQYTEHVYCTPEGLDAYHFMLMHGKAHEVHPVEAALGWSYVSRFARKADGALTDTRKERNP